MRRSHFVCELSDSGPGLDDPYAGYLPLDATKVGAGLWDGLTVQLWV